MPIATSVVIGAKIAGRLHGLLKKDTRRSACFTVQDADIPRFLSGTSTVASDQLIYQLRRQDFDRAGVSSAGISNAALAEMHVNTFVPHCRGLEGDTMFDSGTKAGSQGLRMFDAPTRLWFQNEIKAGRAGQIATGNRTLRGGDFAPDRAGGVPRPSTTAGISLSAPFGGNGQTLMLLVGVGVVAFLATR